MQIVAKKFRKVPISVRVNPQTLSVLDKLGDQGQRNRSEMIDRAIEEYVQSHSAELPAEPLRKPKH